jgi:phosphatidylserine decarboxylase
MNFKVLLQYILPHRALSRVVYWATRWTFAPWKNWLIGTIVRSYQVNMDEAEQTDMLAYKHFNAFFTRVLKPGARRPAGDERTLLCPADGRISQSGAIADGRIFSVAPFAVEAIPGFLRATSGWSAISKASTGHSPW